MKKLTVFLLTSALAVTMLAGAASTVSAVSDKTEKAPVTVSDNTSADTEKDTPKTDRIRQHSRSETAADDTAQDNPHAPADKSAKHCHMKAAADEETTASDSTNTVKKERPQKAALSGTTEGTDSEEDTTVHHRHGRRKMTADSSDTETKAIGKRNRRALSSDNTDGQAPSRIRQHPSETAGQTTADTPSTTAAVI